MTWPAVLVCSAAYRNKMPADRGEEGLVIRRKVLGRIADRADQTKASADKIIEQSPRAEASDLALQEQVTGQRIAFQEEARSGKEQGQGHSPLGGLLACSKQALIPHACLLRVADADDLA